MPEGYALGWSYIPHFIHVRFYTYAYSFAQLVALLLYRRFREDSEAFAPKYLELLARGGSASPADLVAPFGLDLRSTDTWREAFAELDALREEAETIGDTGRAVASAVCSTCCSRGAASSASAAGTLLCAGCRARLPPLTPPLCARCGAPTAWPVARCRECAGRRLAFATARAAVAYDADVRADRLAAGRSAGSAGSAPRRRASSPSGCRVPDVDLVTFVPPDGERRLERGYHPAEQLARALAARGSCRASRSSTRVGRSSRQRGLSLARAAPKRRARLRRRGRSGRGSARGRRLHDGSHRARRRGLGASHAPRGGRDVCPRDSVAAIRVGGESESS